MSGVYPAETNVANQRLHSVQEAKLPDVFKAWMTYYRIHGFL